MDKELILQAPAKVNLFLKILGKRADGYHEIDTVMQAIDWQDTLRFRRLPGPEIVLSIQQTTPAWGVERDPIPTDERNLVVRAARLLQEETGTAHGAEIHLVKRIPSQAGLGGGSADAGVTLRGLNLLWGLNCPPETLERLAARLGSDIPFFAADCRLARCQGRGEQLTPATGRPLHLVIAKPETGLSTAQVYANTTESPFLQSGKDVLNALHEASLGRLKSVLRNGLESAARALNPRVDQLLNEMRGLPFVCSLLSGSGSACVGVCRNRTQALRLAKVLKGRTVENVFVARSRVSHLREGDRPCKSLRYASS